jgi:hypothetical protein
VNLIFPRPPLVVPIGVPAPLESTSLKVTCACGAREIDRGRHQRDA